MIDQYFNCLSNTLDSFLGKKFTFQICVLCVRQNSMNKQRFNEFKSDLKEAFGLIIQRYPNADDYVNNIRKNLGLKYTTVDP